MCIRVETKLKICSAKSPNCKVCLNNRVCPAAPRSFKVKAALAKVGKGVEVKKEIDLNVFKLTDIEDL
jgi:hypothetical protein